ncbi:MAG: hypothetical protein Q8L10_04405 [Candidatus Moranbacteria bacterium]|nr:hypothetical protein [Candidatus Moranbacteria bacterium]
MAYQDQGARPQRQMFDVSAMNITCSECGAAINELPFEPTNKEDVTLGNLFCYECNKKRNANKPRRGGFGGGNRGGFGGGRRF